jgi:hypothetical protein
MKLAHTITLLFIISAILGIMIRLYTPDTNITSLNADGSFVISKSKIAHKHFQKNETSTKYVWYTDPLCDDCINVHKNTADIIKTNMDAGKIKIEFHPVTFVNPKSVYSNITTAWISATADTCDKDIVLSLMDAIYTKSFKANNKSKSEAELIKTLKAVSKHKGAKPKEIRSIVAKLNKVEKMIQSNSNIRDDEDLKKLSPKENKSIFVPFIYNITKDKAYDSESKESDDIILSELSGEPCSGCDDLD